MSHDFQLFRSRLFLAVQQQGGLGEVQNPFADKFSTELVAQATQRID
jgi:hypothetical protein